MAATSKSCRIAAQCWADPRVEYRVMDTELAEVFAEKIDTYRSQLIVWKVISCLFIASAIVRTLAQVIF